MPVKQLDEEALFHAARRIAAGEARELFIRQACGDDAGLAERVRALLEMHEQEPDSAEAPPMRTSDYEPVTERPGSRIGPYRLMEQIGEGGFGLVFVAEQQEPVKRKVALKVIKPGMDTRQVIARFEAVRQALALMDHPNIARVLDAGATDSGRPYFVMELVRGIPITEYCDKNQLTPKDRLELFVTVCQAVQHAHQKGIIHRDIKPSNVLVTSHDGKPVPKIIDFGVAKAISQHLTERTIYTQFAQMIGTPLYMSPEQAEMSGLDIDTRSDIYSLGVLLYELLTGSTPLEKKRFAQAAYDEIRKMIREEEPPRPSTRLSESGDSLPSIAAQRHTEPAKLSKLVRGDLDWITMKCLEKDRTRRYETANGLARDIERHLHDEPVEACPPSPTYRLRKLARKHKAGLATAAAIAALLVAGITVSTWQAVRATNAEQAALAAQQAEAERAEGERQAKQDALAAAASEKKAKETAEASEAETKAVLDFVENKVFAAARPQGQEGGLGHNVKLADAVKAALPFVEKSFKDQPLIEARLRMTIGAWFLDLGDATVAAVQYGKAFAIYSKHRGSDDHATLKSINGLASAFWSAGRWKEALPLWEEVVRMRKAKLDLEDRDAVASMNNLAMALEFTGRGAEALPHYEELINLMKAKLGQSHGDTDFSINSLAFAYEAAAISIPAIPVYEEMLKRMNAKHGPEHTDTATAIAGLGFAYGSVGRHAEAVPLFEKAFRLRQAKLGREHPETMRSFVNLAMMYGSVDRLVELSRSLEDMLILMKAKLGVEHPYTHCCMYYLAKAYHAQGRLADALPLFEESLKLGREKVGRDAKNTLAMQNALATTYAALDRHAEALKLYEDTLQLRKTKLGSDHRDTLTSMNHLAWFLATATNVDFRDPQRAVELAAQAAAKSPKNAGYRGTLGSARYRAGDWKGAIADLEQAISLRKPDDPANANEGFFLAMAHWQLGAKDKAREWFDKAVQWMDKGKKDDAELKRFRAEAAELLGVEQK